MRLNLGQEMTLDPSFDQVAIGRRLLASEDTPTVADEATVRLAPLTGPGAGPRGLPIIDWATTGRPDLAPKLADTPTVKDHEPMPGADVVVITWTSAEWDALHYVFSDALAPLPEQPDHNSVWRNLWRPYRRDFYTVYPDLWSRRLIAAAQNRSLGAPALSPYSMRWGSYTCVTVGKTRVTLFKADLHLNQDGERMPLVTMIRRIVQDADPMLILSIGTSGGVAREQVLGDVVITPAARFHLRQEFASASFNESTFRSSYNPPSVMVPHATDLLLPIPEITVQPPTAHYPEGSALGSTTRKPMIQITDRPVITTDYFEFGTTANSLDQQLSLIHI